MDLSGYIRVMWRFRAVLGVGLLLALCVALTSLARISLTGGKPTLSYREGEVWSSASTLLVTQRGFPWGRAILDDVITVENGTSQPTVVPRFGDPARYSGLAALYAELAKSDAVQREVLKGAPPGERYEPLAAKSADSASMLPLIYMTGYGPTPQAAIDVANRASRSFQAYLERQQAQSDISSDKRVQVVLVRRATPPQIFEARSFVRPIMLFLLIMMATVALAFGLENLRPRLHPTTPKLRAAETKPTRARRSA